MCKYGIAIMFYRRVTLYDKMSEYDLLSMYVYVDERCLSLSMRLTPRKPTF